MQTTQYPIWKTALWFLGILVYGILIIGLGYWVTRGTAGVWILGAGVGIIMFAMPGWILNSHGHTTAGWILVGMAILVVAACILAVPILWLFSWR